MKQLHIGPGRDKLPGFDTLDIRPGYDIQADAAGPLPIADNTYDLVYASHIIEHIPWWKTIDALKEWNRILKPGGTCEIWTVNAANVMRYILDREDDAGVVWYPDQWKRHNPTRDPYLWAAGRIFAYGDGADDPNWHKAMFTPRHLRACCEAAGFPQTSWLSRQKVRGKDHGWVNLGIEARKTSGSDQCTEPGSSGAHAATEPEQHSIPQSKCSQSPALQGISFFELPSQE